jgi:hypothetical protein
MNNIIVVRPDLQVVSSIGPSILQHRLCQAKSKGRFPRRVLSQLTKEGLYLKLIKNAQQTKHHRCQEKRGTKKISVAMSAKK